MFALQSQHSAVQQNFLSAIAEAESIRAQLAKSQKQIWQLTALKQEAEMDRADAEAAQKLKGSSHQQMMSLTS